MESPNTEQEAHAVISTITHPLWEMPKGAEKIIPGMLMEIAAKKADGKYVFSTRARTRAMEALRRLAKDNRDAVPAAAPPQLHVHTNGSVEDIRRVMQDDAQYLEYLRACEANGDPGPVREAGECGDVEAGPASLGDRPGADGRD